MHAGSQQAKRIGERTSGVCVCMKRQRQPSCSPVTENVIRQESATNTSPVTFARIPQRL